MHFLNTICPCVYKSLSRHPEMERIYGEGEEERRDGGREGEEKRRERDDE